MAKNVVAATKNKGKIKELQEIIGAFRGIDGKPLFTLLSLADFGDIPDAVEDGQSFEENAHKKAKHYMKETKCACIADDSGIEIAVLDGAPGIYSARFAGDHASDEENNRKMLCELKARHVVESKAAYRCAVVFIDTDGTVLSADGRVDGTVRLEARGEGGFGYDPYFYLPSGKSMAELSPKEKNGISHRGRALRNLEEKLKEKYLRKDG